jgi:tetratricopeptide (TPR) repeat protein
MQNYVKIPLICVAVSLLLLAGCESDKGTESKAPSDAQDFINQGWSQYTAGLYTEAYQSFQTGAEMAQADYTDAYQDSIAAANAGDSSAVAEATARMSYNLSLVVKAASGVGWTTIKDIEPASGTLAFEQALAIDPNNAEVLAGYAILLHTIEEWQQSNNRATAALAQDPTWDFEHDNQTNYLDLRLLRAENYFVLTDYSASLDEALALNDIVNYDPSLGPEDFNLATIEGRSALIELIEALDKII